MAWLFFLVTLFSLLLSCATESICVALPHRCSASVDCTASAIAFYAAPRCPAGTLVAVLHGGALAAAGAADLRAHVCGSSC
jgi:hypothetical protein